MIRINKISIAQLPELVAISYSGDNELFTKYHVEPNLDWQESVNKTMELIQEAANEVKTSYYKVIYDNKPVGFLVKFKGSLYSFGMAMKFRKKEILADFWNKIVDLMEDKFVCVLYRNNTRAINWLLKCGLFETEEKNPQENLITLTNKI